MITIDNDNIIVNSGLLSCSFSVQSQKDLNKVFDIDIAVEIEKLLEKEEKLGYQPGEYTFSFANRILSLHHKDIKDEIKNNINRIMQRYIYQENDEDTRLSIKADLTNYFNVLHSKGALNSFEIICNEANNKSDDLDKNKLKCRVGLKFKKDDDITIIDAIIKLQEK